VRTTVAITTAAGVAATDAAAEAIAANAVGMEIRKAIQKQPEKVGDIERMIEVAVVAEAITTTIAADEATTAAVAAVVAVIAAASADKVVGSEIRKVTPKQLEKAGAIEMTTAEAKAETAVVAITTTTIEAVAATMAEAVVAEAIAARDRAGMEIPRAILKQLAKAGDTETTTAEAEAATTVAAVMMMIAVDEATIAEPAVAEASAVKADGSEIPKAIQKRLAKVGGIATITAEAVAAVETNSNSWRCPIISLNDWAT